MSSTHFHATHSFCSPLLYLTGAQARSIADLAEASCNSNTIYLSDEPDPAFALVPAVEMLERLGPPTPARQALLAALAGLSRSALLELTALMYLGRGDGLGPRSANRAVRAQFMRNLRDVYQESAEELAFICGDKDGVLHRYLRAGLTRLLDHPRLK